MYVGIKSGDADLKIGIAYHRRGRCRRSFIPNKFGVSSPRVLSGDQRPVKSRPKAIPGLGRHTVMPTAKDRQTTVESNEKQAILGRVVRLLGWPVRSSAMIRGQAVKMV